jgi:hypothetical protein
MFGGVLARQHLRMMAEEEARMDGRQPVLQDDKMTICSDQAIDHPGTIDQRFQVFIYLVGILNNQRDGI